MRMQTDDLVRTPCFGSFPNDFQTLCRIDVRRSGIQMRYRFTRRSADRSARISAHEKSRFPCREAAFREIGQPVVLGPPLFYRDAHAWISPLIAARQADPSNP